MTQIGFDHTPDPPLGGLAGTPVPHPFLPVGDMSSCWRCFGWADDPRHHLPAPMQRALDQQVSRAAAALPCPYPRRVRPYRRAAR